MDKKMSSTMVPLGGKRNPKGRAPTPSDSFIPLGGSSGPSTSSGQTSSKHGIKREATSTSTSSSPLKKQRPISGRKTSDSWSESGAQIDAHELVNIVEDAAEAGDEDRIESALCSAARILKSSRSKPDLLLSLSLMFLAKTKPSLFQSENTIEAFASILKRETQPSNLPLKVKMSNGVQVLTINIIYSFLREEKSWPKSLISVYTQDALNERFWVDSCKGFADNIMCSLGTRTPPKTSTAIVMASNPAAGLMKAEPTVSSSPTIGMHGDDSNSSADLLLCKEGEEDMLIYPRFDHDIEYVHEYIRETTTEYLNRRPLTSEKNILKFLSSVVGIPAVRILIATKIEPWLQNPKLGRSALELFWNLVWNSTGDPDTIGILLKSRVKTKSIVAHFLACIKEFLSQSEDNIQLMLKQSIQNEFSVNRGGNNMAIICSVINFAPEKSTRILAIIFQEMIYKEDCLKNLRLILREIVRSLRYESLNMTLFVATLVDENLPHLNIDPNDVFLRDRIFSSVIDLITLCMFLSVSPTIKEAASYSKNDRKDIMRSFQLQVSEMQRSGLYWIQKSIARLCPEKNEFIHNLNKLLLLEPIDNYCQKDNWPPENDRALVIRLASEIPLLEDSLTRLVSMAFSAHHVTPTEVIEIADNLIKRAASIFESDSRSYSVLQMKNPELFHLLLRSSLYRKPDNIALPSNYTPPELVISDWYWKVWIQLLILTAHNPTHFGKLAWEQFPTLAVLIEMAITNSFEYPPPTSNAEEINAKEQEVSNIEKESIIELENHLAAATSKIHISETNSLLLSKLQLLDPNNVPRRPPHQVLEQLKVLNRSLKLGHLLCQSRSPDFLLDIIQRQQTLKRDSTGLGPSSMPWLNQLVEVHEDNYSALPVQCLCEFLLGQIHDEAVMSGSSSSASSNTSSKSGAPSVSKQSDKIKEKDKKRKLKKLVSYFCDLLKGDEHLSKLLIDYFMKRLSSHQTTFRLLAAKALRLILTPKKEQMTDSILQDKQQIDAYASFSPLFGEPEDSEVESDYDFLDIMTSKDFEGMTESVCESLRWALLVETNPAAVSKFVNFLCEMSDASDVSACLSVAHLLIDRPAVLRMMTQSDSIYKDSFMTSCSQLFLNHLSSVKQKGEPQFSWSDAQDRVIIQWESTKESAVLNISIIHAMVILLTVGPVPGNERFFNQMMSIWFCQPPPQSFLLDTSEEALLLPDWLKLRLLRSKDSRLIDAALKDLESAQLVLFIQTFGLPTTSMEKLLALLDDCCEDDEETVRASIPDERFMKHLIEVQWMRGVKTGHKFASMLGVHDSSHASLQASSSRGISASSSSSIKNTIHLKNEKSSATPKPEQREQEDDDASLEFVGGKVDSHTFINFLQKLSSHSSSETSSLKDKRKSINNFVSNFSKEIGKELFQVKKEGRNLLTIHEREVSLTTQFILDINNLLSPKKGKQHQTHQQLSQFLTQLLQDNLINSLLVIIASAVSTASSSLSESSKSSSRLYCLLDKLLSLLTSHHILKTSVIHGILTRILKKKEVEEVGETRITDAKKSRRRESPEDEVTDKSSSSSKSSPNLRKEEESGESDVSFSIIPSNESESEDEWNIFLTYEVERSVTNSRELLHYLESEGDLKKLGVQAIFESKSSSSKESIDSHSNASFPSSHPSIAVKREWKHYLLPLLLHKTNFETIRMLVHKLLSPPVISPFFSSVNSTETTTSYSSKTRIAAGDSIAPQMTPAVKGKPASLIDLSLESYQNSVFLDETQESGATLVLDILTACLDCPRLWRGRDLTKPTHFILEDILNLNELQVSRLIDFVMKEGRYEKRVDLLLRSCFFKRSHISLVFRKLAGIRESLHLKEGQEEQRMMMIMMEEGKNKEEPFEGVTPTTSAALTSSSTTNKKEKNHSNHTTTVSQEKKIPSSLKSLLSRLPASSFDLNLCRQDLTTFFRSLSPPNPSIMTQEDSPNE
jgi:hypothetical protein